MNGLFAWFNARFPLLSTWKSHASDYYVPKNFNFFYFFGSIALVMLLNQLVSGLWLAMFYTPTAADAFNSIQYLMRDVRGGWLLRYLHSTGASALFIVLYLHLFRSLLYGSYQKPRELVWLFGVALFLLLLLEAFFGYLLPWGQMSYWACEVITSLLSVIPYVGEGLATWVRGDYAVSTVTLQRFYALHVIGMPLLILFIVYLHLIALHHVGSNNPEGIEIREHLDTAGKPLDGIPLHPYYTVKDFFGIVFFLLFFFMVVFFFPDFGGYFLEADNFMPANPLVTPDHIVPMWYMVPFYSMLKAIPNKLLGVVILACALTILLFLPWLDKSPVRSMRYKGHGSRWILLGLVLSFVILGYLGMRVLTPWSQLLARICTAVYFAYFIFMPFYTWYERSSAVPARIK